MNLNKIFETPFFRRLKFVGCIFPVIFALLIVEKFGVNVPVWDQWEYVPFFQDLHAGTLTLSELFAQQLEYRQFFPNILYVFLGKQSNWNVIWEMRFSWILQLMGLALVLRQAKRSGILTPSVAVVFSFLVFNPFQMENWLNGVQIEYFLGNLGVLFAIIFAASNSDIRLKLLFVVLGCELATFSSANGLLSFIVSGFVIAGSLKDKDKIKSLILIAITFVGSVVIYFSGYKKPASHPDVLTASAELGRAILYFFSFLGRPFEGFSFIIEDTEQHDWHQRPTVALSAMLGLLLFSLFIRYFFAWFSSKSEKSDLIPWLALGAYPIGTAVLTTIGRLGFGVQQSLSPRYVSFSLWLPIALVAMEMLRKEKQISKTKAILYSLITVNILLGYSFAVAKGRQYRQSRNQVKACIVFSNISDNRCIEEIVYPNRQIAISRAKFLSVIGYLTPRMLTSNELSESGISIVKESLIPEGFGRIHSVTLQADGDIQLTGSASLPNRKSKAGSRQSPEFIVVTAQNISGTQIIATALPEQQFVWLKYPGKEQNEIRWRWSVLLKKGTDKDSIQVWSYDVVNNSISPIGDPIFSEKINQEKTINLNLLQELDEPLANIFVLITHCGEPF